MRYALQKNLTLMALRDLLSKKVRLVLNLLGIVIGVSALLFLLSLTEGIRKMILRQLVGSIPVTEMTATPAERDVAVPTLGRAMKLFGIPKAESLVLRERLRGDITDETVAEVEALPGVRRVYGVRTLKQVPTSVQGWFFGIKKADFRLETVVFGYPRELLEGDVEDLSDYTFRAKGVYHKRPFHTRFISDVERPLLTARMRLAEQDQTYVPAVLSRQLVSNYNLGFAATEGLAALQRVSERSVIGQLIYVRFGRDEMFYTEQDLVEPLGTVIKVVGLSDRVPMLGFAVPPEYLELWENAYFKAPQPSVYQQLVVQAKTVADVEPLRQALLPVGARLKALREARNVSLEQAATAAGLKPAQIEAIEAGPVRTIMTDTEAHRLIRAYASALKADPDEMAAAYTRGFDMEVVSNKETIDKINSVTTFVRFAFVLVVAIILGITAVGILNVLTMSVYEERVDIGILRSVGARKGHVRFIYLLKAFLIGLIGSLAGLALGWLSMMGADALAHAALRRLAYVPQTFFIADWQFVAFSMAMGIGFAMLAGISPANHAARLKPSAVLRSA
ncbi:MAG: helix-turn-helix domain-containing protein [Verrucomicrobia bacterium]|nr:helix-turn-helix domain-containing protein [Verrucomicrobiota bacterium]